MSSYRDTRRSARHRDTRDTRDISRSPNRETYDRYDRYSRDSRDIDLEVRENIAIQTNNNTPILLTPFTFGVEWEPSNFGQYQPPDNKKHYDRETIFISSKKNLNVTIEDYKMKSPEQAKKSCKYNIEFSIGVLGKNPPISMNNFLNNNKIFIPKIEEEIIESTQKEENK